jgi:hypothetical protein
MTDTRERPILFQGAMVRAILASTKTQTRRMVKHSGELFDVRALVAAVQEYVPAVDRATGKKWGTGSRLIRCPYGAPSGRLWVRESWARDDEDGALFYRADVGTGNEADDWQRNIDDGASGYRWRPSIHMPRAACRLVLEVTEVRVQRLQDISEADCWAEGIEAVDGAFTRDQHIDMTRRLGCRIDDAKPSYALLWESINGPGSWDANPWVWAVSFRRGTP